MEILENQDSRACFGNARPILFKRKESLALECLAVEQADAFGSLPFEPDAEQMGEIREEIRLMLRIERLEPTAQRSADAGFRVSIRQGEVRFEELSNRPVREILTVRK